MFSAEWLRAAAIDWLSSATSIRRVWIVGLSTDETKPVAKTKKPSAKIHCAVSASSTSTTASADEPADQRALEIDVGEVAADEVADRHAEAHQHEHDRHDPLGRPGDLGDHRRDVAVHGEESAEADGADAEREPDLPDAEDA